MTATPFCTGSRCTVSAACRFEVDHELYDLPECSVGIFDLRNAVAAHAYRLERRPLLRREEVVSYGSIVKVKTLAPGHGFRKYYRKSLHLGGRSKKVQSVGDALDIPKPQ